jgi:hypothetical protein
LRPLLAVNAIFGAQNRRNCLVDEYRLRRADEVALR